MRPWYVKPLHAKYRMTCVCLPHTQGRNLWVRLRNALAQIHKDCTCECDGCRPNGEAQCVAMARVPHDVSTYIDKGTCASRIVDFGNGVTTDLASLDCYLGTCPSCPPRMELLECEKKDVPLKLRMFQRLEEQKKKRGQQEAETRMAWRIAPQTFDGPAQLKEALDDLVDNKNSDLNCGTESFKYHRFKNHFLAAAQDVTIRNLGVNDAFIEIDYAMALSMCSLEDLQQVCTHTTPSP